MRLLTSGCNFEQKFPFFQANGRSSQNNKLHFLQLHLRYKISSTSLGLVVVIHINPHHLPRILPLRRHEIEIGLHVLRRPVLPLVDGPRQRERVAVHVALRVAAPGPLQRPGVPHVRGDPRGSGLGPLDVARDGLRGQRVAAAVAVPVAVHVLLLLFLGFERVEGVVGVGGGVVLPGGVRD